jgi:hypothetical protein
MSIRCFAPLVFLMVLLPAVLAHERFVTADEAAQWFKRSQAFERALEAGRLEDTWQSGHPGVTTMWAGLLGRAAWETAGGEPTPTDPETRHAHRGAQRFVVSALCAAALAASAVLLLPTLGAPTAALAAAFWAFDPFLGAHARILHVDALAACFFMLALCAAASARPRPVLAGVATALSTLSKLTGAIAVPLVLALWLVRTRSAAPQGDAPVSAPSRLRTVGLYLVAGLVTVLLVCPAFVVSPTTVFTGLHQGMSLGAAAHEYGNFFWGEPIKDPGRWFYPVAVLYRLTPITTIGLLLSLGALRTGPRLLRFAWLASLLVLIVLGEHDKKFDRYALLVFPLLDLVAAVGWMRVLEGLTEGRGRRIGRLGRGVGLATLGACALFITAREHPYQLAYFNPLLGGLETAQRKVLVGWGEGLEQVGDFLTARDPGCEKTISTVYPKSLEPFVCARMVSKGNAKKADYVVDYVNEVQRHPENRLLRDLKRQKPLFVARHDGVALAWVYSRAQVRAASRPRAAAPPPARP